MKECGGIIQSQGDGWMLTQDRQRRILDELAQKKSVTVTELVEEIGVSESTIRRDLVALDKAGRLSKVHGGATALEHEFVAGEYDVNTKSKMNAKEKDEIARYAATLINDQDYVFIDAGTSTEAVISYLNNDKATYVTNGIVHAKKLIAKGYKTYMIGGRVKPVTEAVVGAEGVRSLMKYNFTKAFVGTNGIHKEFGYTTVDVEEAAIKREIVKRSYVTYILADHTKFDLVTAIRFADIEEACIITDYCTKEKYKTATVLKEVLKHDLHSDI